MGDGGQDRGDGAPRSGGTVVRDPAPPPTPDGGVVPERSPDGGVVPERSPDGGVVPERTPDGGVVPERTPDDGVVPGPGTDRDPTADLLQRMLEETAAVRRRLEDLTERGRAEQARAEAREQVIAHQRADLDALRAERRGGHLRPVVVGLQKVRAELLDEAATVAADGSAPPRLAGVLAYHADAVASVLEGCGVEAVPVAVGDPVDPSAHRVRRTVPTGPEQHGRVVEVLVEGWVERDSGRVLGPAGVVVGRHEAPLPPEPQPGLPPASPQPTPHHEEPEDV